MRGSLSIVAGLLAGCALFLAGCGQEGGTVTVTTTKNPDGSLTVVARPAGVVSQGASQMNRVPAPSTAGRSSGAPTPDLGGGGPGQPSTPPPNVSIGKPPTSDLQFDANLTAVLERYRIVIRGNDATKENVDKVAKAAQLYQTRRHTLTAVVQRDRSKLPVAGVWYPTSPNSATTELYQPQMQHVADHEVAHDLTIFVDPQAGQRLGNAIVANKNNPTVFPTSYARSRVPEAMAEALSWWAEKVARPGSGNPYNPPAAIVAGLQPFLSDGLRNK